MSQPAPIEWIRPPHQARTQRSLASLLDAAETLLAERSFDDVTITAIVERAGSSVGGFYRRFQDKEALLHALHERYVDEARATAEAALNPDRWRHASLQEAVAAFTEMLVRVDAKRAGLRRAVAARALEDPTFRARQQSLRKTLVAGLRSLLDARRDEIAHPDLDVASRFVLRMVFGVLSRRADVRDSDDDLLPLAPDRVGAELTRACVAYLASSAEEPTGEGAS